MKIRRPNLRKRHSATPLRLPTFASLRCYPFRVSPCRPTFHPARPTFSETKTRASSSVMASRFDQRSSIINHQSSIEPPPSLSRIPTAVPDAPHVSPCRPTFPPLVPHSSPKPFDVAISQESSIRNLQSVPDSPAASRIFLRKRLISHISHSVPHSVRSPHPGLTDNLSFLSSFELCHLSLSRP